MANYANLIALVNDAIKTNGIQAITGQLLQTVLDEMIGSLGTGYQFAGLASPGSVAPSTDAKIFLFASEAGEYSNFHDSYGNPIELAEGELAILANGTYWTKYVIATLPLSSLTISTDVPDLSYNESEPQTIADQMGQSIADVLATGAVRFVGDVAVSYYKVIGYYGAEGGYITFIGTDKVYQYDVNASGYITDEKVTSVAPDDELSETSENAVQNKVVKAAFDAKQDKDTNAIEGNVAVMDANGNSKGSNVPLDNVAKIDGQYDTLTSGYAGNLIDKSDAGSEQQIMFRKTGGATEVAESTRAMFKRLLGRSLVWNQLLTSEPRSVTGNGVTFTQNANGSVTLSGTATATALYAIFGTGENTLIAGHQYILRGGHAGDGANSCMLAINENASYTAIASPSSMFPVVSGRLYALYIRVAAGTNVDGVVYWPQLTDLTVMYGAGYEPASVAEYESVYNKQHHPYNAGTFFHNLVQTYEATGQNQWDEEWEVGGYNTTTGEKRDDLTQRIRSKNHIRVIGGASYSVLTPSAVTILMYDANGNLLSFVTSGTFILNLAQDVCTITFYMANNNYGNTYNHDICINLSNPDINGTYAPYVKAIATLGLSSFRVKDGQGNITTIHGLKGTGATYNEIDVENKTYIERVGMRAYQSGDDSDTSVLTDGTNTLAPLAEPVVYDLVDDMPEYSQVWGVGTENILPEGVDENGVPKTTPLRAVIYYPKDYTGIINNLPKTYISTASLTNMLNALKSAGIIRSFTMTWNAEAQTYNFTIS